MKYMPQFLLLLVVVANLAACNGRPELLDGDGLVVLSGVTIIDGTGQPPLSNAVLVIGGENIYRVGKVGDFRYPADATLLPVAGQYVIPGLMDVHAHVRGYMVNTLLAFGITTIRSPGTRLEPWEERDPPSLGIALRDRLARRNLQGPRMFSAGPLIDVPEGLFGRAVGGVRREEEMRQEVHRQVETGVDYVKVYMGVPDTLLAAAVQEAHQQHVRVLGHLKRTSWTRAAELGIDGLMHACSEGPTWELLDDEREGFLGADWGTSLRAWAAVAQQLNGGPAFDRLVGLLVQNRVEVNPTLVTLEALYWADDSKGLEEMAPPWVPPNFTQRWSGNWENNRNFMAQWGLAPSEWQQLKVAFSACQQMVRQFHERGVLLTAGSDVGSWMTPGLSLHRDLQLLADSGLSPLEVIRVATSNGAEALGISDEVGTLQAGKLADIVVLRDDPLEDMGNTLSIDLVIHRGITIHPAELLAQDREYAVAPTGQRPETGSGLTRG